MRFFVGSHNIIVFAATAAMMLWANIGITQIEWDKSSENPLIERGISGGWDTHALSDFAVVFDETAPEGEQYKMWYSATNGPSTYYKMGLLTSSDGIGWTPAGLVDDMDNPEEPDGLLGPSGAWDDWRVHPHTVLFDEDPPEGAEYKYKMWYAGSCSSCPDPAYTRIGYATSEDGLIWTKRGLVDEPGKHGLVDDIDNPEEPDGLLGADGEWDDYRINSPSVVYDETAPEEAEYRYRMWYSGYGGSPPWGIGYAISQNGIEWQKPHQPDPLIQDYNNNISAPHVLFDGSKYHMWYSQSEGYHQKIRLHYATGHAAPPDNPIIDWELPSILVDDTGNPEDPDGLLGPNGTWDDFRIYLTSILLDNVDRKYKMWYLGTADCCTTPAKIGYATSTIPISPCNFSLIESNFNGTPIAEDNYIWFNSIMKVKGVGDDPVTMAFTDQKIEGLPTGSVDVPDAVITFTPSAPMATTEFSSGMWQTEIPLGFGKNIFLSGLPFPVPSGGFPGGINPVIWSGEFASTDPNITIEWKWAAAVYTTFGTADELGVKPVDGDKLNPYHNSDHAGTPENFKDFVTGGARGGGGSNFTGSYSGTRKVKCFTLAAPSPVVDTGLQWQNEKMAITPSKTALLNNYPNPFNPDTWIPYQLAEDIDVSIRIHDVSGQLIRKLDLGHKSAGLYTDKSKAAYWDGKSEAGEQVSSGVYFYTIRAGDFVATKKMILTK